MKDPWLAINLSLFFPGIGQLYAGKKLKGWLLLGIEVGLIAIASWSIFAPNGKVFWGLGISLFAIGIYLGNLFDAYHCVIEDFATPPAEIIPRTRKSPWFAVFLCRIIPGLGQFYTGRVAVGGLLLGSITITVLLDEIIPQLLWITPLITAIAVYHVYHTFPHPPPQKKPTRTVIQAIVVSLIITGIFLNYFPLWLNNTWELFIIPSSSMQPTLQIGDRILVNKSKNISLQRGDLVVFFAPEAAKQLDPTGQSQATTIYIKRIIGQPEETLTVTQGRVYINGIPLTENYIAASPNYEIPSQPLPERMYWVLGDNRNASFDSHVWGVLQEQKIIGKAYKIVFPPHRVGSLINGPTP